MHNRTSIDRKLKFTEHNAFSTLVTVDHSQSQKSNMTITERDTCHTSFDDDLQGWSVKGTTGGGNFIRSVRIHKRKVTQKKVIIFSSIFVKKPEDMSFSASFLQATSRKLLEKPFSFCFASPC